MSKRPIVGAASPAKTRAIMEHLLRAFEEYLNREDQPPVEYLDAFMGVHNFHKAILLHLIEETAMQGEAARLFLQMASDTFRRAMEEAAAKRTGN